jgi:hypothetical protein
MGSQGMATRDIAYDTRSLIWWQIFQWRNFEDFATKTRRQTKRREQDHKTKMVQSCKELSSSKDETMETKPQSYPGETEVSSVNRKRKNHKLCSIFK